MNLESYVFSRGRVFCWICVNLSDTKLCSGWLECSGINSNFMYRPFGVLDFEQSLKVLYEVA